MAIEEQTCLCCGHTWYPRSEERPEVCPRCKNPRWDKGLKNPEKTAEKRKERLGGHDAEE